MLIWLIACAIPEPEVQVASESFDPAEWRFPSESQRQRHEAVRSELMVRFAGAKHTPLERVGNFLRETWTDGDRQATLNVLHAPHLYPEVFGLVLDTKDRRGDVASTVHWSLDGGTITGDGFTVTFDAPGGALKLTSDARYEIGPETVRLESAPTELAAELTASPHALRVRGSALTDELAEQVRAHLDSGRARRCRDGEPPGDGRPPECILIPLGAEEVAREQDRLAAWTVTRKQLLTEHAEVLHTLLVAQVPGPLR